MKENVDPSKLRPGDTVEVNSALAKIRNIKKMRINNWNVFWVFREPDGRLIASLHDSDSIVRVVPKAKTVQHKKPTRRQQKSA